MIYITGSYVVKRKSIKVEFMEDDIGTIVARTCSNLIIFPRIFKDDINALSDFCRIMNNVIELDLKGLRFNTV